MRSFPHFWFHGAYFAYEELKRLLRKTLIAFKTTMCLLCLWGIETHYKRNQERYYTHRCLLCLWGIETHWGSPHLPWLADRVLTLPMRNWNISSSNSASFLITEVPTLPMRNWNLPKNMVCESRNSVLTLPMRASRCCLPINSFSPRLRVLKRK